MMLAEFCAAHFEQHLPSLTPLHDGWIPLPSRSRIYPTSASLSAELG
jgi:hypothetical protein